jgi:hypothetical protein
MNTTPDRCRNASRGDVGARVAVVLGLATAVGLLVAGGGQELEHEAAYASCAPRPNPAFAAF